MLQEEGYSYDLTFQDFTGTYEEVFPSLNQSSDFKGNLTPGPTRNAINYSETYEPPLLEELEIYPDQIKRKALVVINPFVTVDAHLMDTADVAGPLFFILAYGAFLLLSGKLHFGYIYGVGVIGSFCTWALLNLMSLNGISIWCTCSVLGYSLLPMVLLSSFSIFWSLKGVFGLTLAGLSILWCAISASRIFVQILSLQEQRLLIAYPCVLVYAVFALMTIY
ncbi:protein YIPF5-like [Zophobas morio]|uniref:protein YIPF5-like n=1 Tax=Zophobas morio TaxID=2755281 RepID=UPI003083A60E